MSTPQLDKFYELLKKKKIEVPAGVFIAGFDVYEAVGKGLNISRMEAKKLVLKAQFHAKPFEFAHADNPALDGTEKAHPAWTRGCTKGFFDGVNKGIEVMCRDVNDLIDGIPVPNSFPTHYHRSREETLERVKQLRTKMPGISDKPTEPKMDGYRLFRVVGLPFRFLIGWAGMAIMAGVALFIPKSADAIEKILNWVING